MKKFGFCIFPWSLYFAKKCFKKPSVAKEAIEFGAGL